MIEYIKNYKEVEPCRCGIYPTLVLYSFGVSQLYCPKCYRRTISSFSIKDVLKQWNERGK